MRTHPFLAVPVRGARRIASLAAAAAALLFVSGVAAAQQGGAIPLSTPIDVNTGVPMQATSKASGFNLFAAEDLAGISLKMTGQLRYPLVNAGGICPFANTAGDIFNTQCGQFGGASTYFHNVPVWGIGPDDYAKVLAVWPNVAKMLAPVGYSTPWRRSSIPPVDIRINSADGQFGQFFSGVTSADGQGCRDMTGAAGAGVPSNFTLTASLICPDTWGALGYDGIREVPDSIWAKHFAANPNGFNWNDWQIPTSEHGNYLGTNSTYGAFSDYFREALQMYGVLTPKGPQGTPPGDRGFPLGLYVRADAFKFDRPSIRDGVFIRWLVVNKSADVYGKGIDYDKIFMGMDPGYTIGGQRPAAANIMSQGVHYAFNGGWSGKCNTTTYPRRTPPGATNACQNNGTNPGALPPRALMFLKSPLGDLRNKMFSDPTSAYYAPTNPLAGDTITFNQWRRGDFGGQDTFSWRRSDRSMWGLLSGDEQAWLDGRQFSDFTAGQIWVYFMYEGTDGAQSLANLRYNRSVPSDIPGYGKWDYNHDGIPDTIKVPDCGVQGCVTNPWTDTIAGGYSNFQAANIGNFLGVGPFKLKAGDTTEFLMYLGGGNDTLAVARLVANVTSSYFKNFAGASAYPTPSFTANDVQLNSAWFRDSTAGSANTEVRIQIKMPPQAPDPFLKQVLTRINGTDATATNLRNLNPNLVNLVTGRMNDNLAQVIVFKSCDNGVSWTTDAGCTSATGTFQARDQDGNNIGLGWRPRFTFNEDTVAHALSGYIVSDVVPSGRNYLYSFVTKSRGLKDILVTTAVTLNASGQVTSLKQDNLQNVLGVDIDSITSPLVTSGPSTVVAYAPLSVPAGTIYATLDTARAQATFVTNRVTTQQRTAQASGVFRMRFGNQFIITRTVDTISGARTTTIIRRSRYANAATDPAGAVTPGFIASADTFFANHDFSYQSPAANNLRTTPRSAANVNPQVFVDTITAPGYLLGKGSGGATDPYFLAIGTSFAGGNFTQNTATFEGSPWFPGMTVTVNSETASPSAREAFMHRTPEIVNPCGTAALTQTTCLPKGAYVPGGWWTDTMNTGNVNTYGAIWSGTTSGVSSALFSSPGGFYRVKWSGDSWGSAGNTLRFDVASVMQPIVTSALAGRPVTTVADTDATAQALKAVLIATPSNGVPVNTRPLIAAKMPFKFLGADGTPVSHILMLQRHIPGNIADSLLKNSRLIGTSGDTARVIIPPDVWMPGDSLYVFEKIMTDSTATVGGVSAVITHDSVVNGTHQQLPIQVPRELLSMRAVLFCSSNSTPSRFTCNPLALGTRASTGYLPYQNGMEYRFLLNRLFDQNSEVSLTAQPVKAAALPLTKTDGKHIYVVPNPYVVQSSFDQIASNRTSLSQLRFVNVPQEGMMRIYSISGQLVQQLSWTAADLINTGNGTPNGDLPYNLRTKEGLALASGVYLYVIEARGANANGLVAKGKFVVIR